MKKQISIDNAPKAIGAYSQGIIANNIIFISGQLPINPENSTMPDGIIEQTRQSLENVKAILVSEGLTCDNVVKTAVFMTNLEDFASMNEVYAEYFKQPYPARSAFQVSRLPKGAFIEIECIAVR